MKPLIRIDKIQERGHYFWNCPQCGEGGDYFDARKTIQEAKKHAEAMGHTTFVKEHVIAFDVYESK